MLHLPYLLFKPRVQSLAEAKGQLKHSVVRGEDQDIARRIEDDRTNFAVVKVLLNKISHLRWQPVV